MTTNVRFCLSHDPVSDSVALRNEYSPTIFQMKRQTNKQENVWFPKHNDGKKNVHVDLKCLKFHLEFIGKTTTTGSVPLKRVNNESVNESGESPPCSVMSNHQQLRYLIQDFSCINCTLSFISKLNAGSVLKGKVVSPKSDAILVLSTIGLIKKLMSLVGLANGKPCKCSYACVHRQDGNSCICSI